MHFEPITITLTKPLMHGHEEITTITFGREMVAGDIRDMPVRDLTHGNVLTVTQRIAGIPAPILAGLSMPDYMAVYDVVNGFFGDSPQTGESA